MKQLKHPKLSALALAIGLACGATALADDNTGQELTPNYDQQTEQAPSASEQETKYDNLDDPVSQPSTGEDMAREVEPAESTSGDLDTSREEYASSTGEDAAGESAEEAAFLDESTQSENQIAEFAAAIEQAGLADALTAGTEYTIFAPTDEAFQAYTADKGEVQIEELREVLRAHIVAGTVDSEQVKSLDSARVLTGETVSIAQDGDKLTIGDAELVSADIRSGNLTIHTIDAVLEAEGGDSWQAMESAEESQQVEQALESESELPDPEEAE